MDMKWPEDYQERIETIIGAQYDETKHVYFLGFDFKTAREARACMGQIRLMQKQLRQVKTELANNIKVLKTRRMPPGRKKDGAMYVLGSLMSNLTVDHKISRYQYAVLNVNKLLDACEKRRVEIEAWIEQNKPSVADGPTTRSPIPEDVQLFVWNRDGGKCVKCGSQENLEFDHIIPVSRGGSNTARNIQLLCECCNRAKSNTVGG